MLCKTEMFKVKIENFQLCKSPTILTAQVCIVFTDGIANDRLEVPAASAAWAGIGAKVFAVGIGRRAKENGKGHKDTRNQ